MTTEILEKPDITRDDVTVVASISGGKDSTAMSLYLTEQGIEHRRIFADTGWEHPATVEFVGQLDKHLGPIETVRNELGFEKLCYKKGMFPSRMRRFCTEMLKVKPILLYLESIEGEAINTVGIRSQESLARSKLPEWEFNASMDRWVWRPLIRWTLQDVVAIHRRHGVPPNPLYVMGAERVGCWPCIFSRKSEIRMVSEKTPERIDLIRAMEKKVADLAAERYAKKGETFESLGYVKPSFFHPHSTKNTESKQTMTPIDDVVEWSKTSFGGRQFELFHDAQDTGCVRWGLCEST